MRIRIETIIVIGLYAIKLQGTLIEILSPF